MTDNSSTLLKVQLSEYVEPAPVVPDTDEGGKGSSPGAGNHGFQTVEAVGTEEAAQTTSNAVPIAFIGLAFFILIFIILSLVKKQKSNYSPYASNPKLTKLQVLSSVAASVFLAVVFNSALFSYTLPTAIDTTVSEELTIDANILGTDNIAYVKDTITIPASQYGYDLYVSTDDSGESRLIADSSEGVINSITTAGALQDNTYGFSFVDPAVDATKFYPVQPKSGRTSVLSLSPEETTTEKHIDIWYAVRSKTAPEDVYRVNIEYKTIGEQDITLQEMTPELCADLEVGILDYFFTNELDGEQYNVIKLADGNCWTKPITEEDPEEPEEPVKVCPTGWHEANNYNYNDLDIFYDVNNPETTSPEAIVNLKKDDETGEFSCIADFDSALVSFDSNGVDVANMPDDINVPSDEPQIQIQNFIYAIPELPALETDATCQDFLGWSLLPDATEPLYPVDSTQPQPATFSSPRVTLYAVWSNAKTAKAILDENGLLNFVYDYCSVEDLEDENNVAGQSYRAAYEANLENNATIKKVYLVPERTNFTSRVAWLEINRTEEETSTLPAILSVNFDTSFFDFKPTSTGYWFNNLTNLKEVTNLDNFNTEKDTNMLGMFEHASSLEEINYRNEKGEVIHNEFPSGFGQATMQMSSMFSYASSLVSITFPIEFGKELIYAPYMFAWASSLEEINYRNEKGEIIHNELPSGFGNKGEQLSGMFNGVTSLTSITFPSGFGANANSVESQINTLDSMFYNASSLEHINYRNEEGEIIYDEFPSGFGSKSFNTINMFAKASSLTSITFPVDFGGQVTAASYMFEETSSLEHINYRNEEGEIIYDEFPSGFGSKATRMARMFSKASKLTSLTFPVGFGAQATGIDHNAGHSMYSMFYNASSLEHINYRNEEGEIIYDEFPSGFGSKAMNTESMFSGASKLTSLTFPSDFGGQLVKTASMFKDTSSLQRIYVPDGSDWNTESIISSTNMFANATRLVGEDGISYSGSHARNITNAHIGYKDGVPGYFTRVCMKDNSCPAESSGNSTPNTNSLNYAPLSIDNTEPESTDSTPSSEPETPENPSGEGPAPLGVAKTSKTDNSTMILFAIAMACLSSGTTLFILMIERLKREYSEEEQF